MLFLNGIAMFALAAIAVPIIIHLHRRRNIETVDWAAMQFLSHSLTSRRHGLAFEHLLLLLCRCLLIAIFVSAMARPYISSLADLRWVSSMLLGFAGLIALLAAVVFQDAARKRVMAAVAGLVLLVLAGALSWLGELPDGWQQGQPRDVAIVMDASSSMKVQVDGQSNFQRAIEEARLLVDQLPGGSTGSLIVAGPVLTSPQTIRTNLRSVSDEIGQLKAMGGGADLKKAIEYSCRTIERGPNRDKQVVVFSDNQLCSWQLTLDDTEPKKKDADSNDHESERQVELYGRAFPLPDELKDVAVVDLQVDHNMIGTGRPARFKVELLNNGSMSVSDLEVELLIDGKQVQTESAIQIEPKSRNHVDFRYRFEQSGWHTISARLSGEDRLADNNVFHRVVHVVADVPVLIVNGDSTSDRFRRSATFAQLALDPGSLQESRDPESKRSGPIGIETIDTAEIQQMESLSGYDVVLLCDVPRLPSPIADQLVEFVHRGGGLWVFPGPRCQPDFYNVWSARNELSGQGIQAKSDRWLMPAELIQRIVADPSQGSPFGLDLDTVSDPTIRRLLETGQHDLSKLQVTAHWQLARQAGNPPVQIGALLTSGDPLLVQQRVGRGCVMLFAISLDSFENNFNSLISFPVLMHLWTNHLAAIHGTELNVRPQRDLLLPLRASDMPHRESWMLKTPDRCQRPIHVSSRNGTATVEVGLAAAPGIYQLVSGESTDGVRIPFAVGCDPEEYDLTAASNEKLAELAERLPIRWIADVDQLGRVAQGTSLGIELWKYFAAAAMALIVMEAAVMRWVTVRRRVDVGQASDRPAMWSTTHSSLTFLNTAPVSRRNKEEPQRSDSSGPLQWVEANS